MIFMVISGKMVEFVIKICKREAQNHQPRGKQNSKPKPQQNLRQDGYYQIITSVEDVENLDPSYTADGNLKW